MPKNKPTKGLLKRIRITKSGLVKFRRAFGRHRRSHKSSSLLQSYRRPAFAKACDVKRIRAMVNKRVRGGDTKMATSTEETTTNEEITAGEP